MIAYKGFNKNLQAKLGKGTYQYEVGQTYKEDECKTAHNGFHCVEEPLEVLRWYRNPTDRYCIVQASGDIDEDIEARIACTELTILKEISKLELVICEAKWIELHPYRNTGSYVLEDKGIASRGFAVVRGKNPIAKGKKGDILCLLQERKNSRDIEKIVVAEVDNDTILSDVYYDIHMKGVGKCTKKN